MLELFLFLRKQNEQVQGEHPVDLTNFEIYISVKLDSHRCPKITYIVIRIYAFLKYFFRIFLTLCSFNDFFKTTSKFFKIQVYFVEYRCAVMLTIPESFPLLTRVNQSSSTNRDLSKQRETKTFFSLCVWQNIVSESTSVENSQFVYSELFFTINAK